MLAEMSRMWVHFNACAWLSWSAAETVFSGSLTGYLAGRPVSLDLAGMPVGCYLAGRQVSCDLAVRPAACYLAWRPVSCDLAGMPVGCYLAGRPVGRF